MTEGRASTLGRALERVLGLWAGVVLLFMMWLTFFDVLSRNVLGRPINGAFELTELSLAVLIFAGLPLVVRAGEHVSVDIVALPFRGIADKIAGAAVEAASGVLLLGVSWLLWERAIRYTGYGDHTMQLDIPIGPFIYLMSGLMALSALIHLLLAGLRLVRPPERD